MLDFGDMAKMQQLACDAKTRKILQQRASSQTESHRDLFRARIILGCLDGRGFMELARALKTRPNTVIKWRDRFAALQLEGLEDQARPGAPRRLPLDLRERILQVLEEPPPAGQAVWDGGAVAQRWPRFFGQDFTGLKWVSAVYAAFWSGSELKYTLSGVLPSSDE